MILDNISPAGSLNTDRVARALLIHHNQTDPISGLSPAEVIFGRRLRDHLPLQDQKFQPRAEWRLEADQREKAFAKRHILKREQLSRGSKELHPLAVGDNVAIQDASNLGKPGKWTKTGLVTDCLPFQSYEIKVDGSNSLTKRNRVHLRKIVPFVSQSMLDEQRLISTPAPVTTRSSSTRSPSPPSATPSPSPPGLSPGPSPPHQSSPPQPVRDDIFGDSSNHPQPEAPPEVFSTNPTPQPKPRIKERWILSNQTKTTPTYSSSSSPVETPPPPGHRHDYAALAERAKELRDSIMSARTANLTT